MPSAAASNPEAAGGLYASRVRVYPRAVNGPVRRLKWAVLILCLAVYYLAPWLRWDRGPGHPDQALLIDLPNRRGYFFAIEIWPQEVYYLAGLLILAAVALFFVTSLFGRLWCGYGCPQTVWTDLYLLAERLIEGDRAVRMQRDRAGWTVGKAARKAAKHAVWLLIALLTGGAWVMYFYDAPSLVRDILALRPSQGALFFIGLFTATTYLLAGWAREQVCTYMCPWPRFQAAMLDEQSVIVTYQKARGEPRGKHKAGDSWEGRGDCVDCRLCVNVCPTGIDIRDGQQIECIGCGLCVDACNETMRKVDRPLGLIRWDTLARQQAREQGRSAPWKAVRPRTILYAAMFAIVAIVMAVTFFLRTTADLSAQRDRSPNFVRLSNGDIRNSYTVKISNKDQHERRFVLELQGLPGAALAIANPPDANPGLPVHADNVGTFRVLVTVPAGQAPSGSHAIEFRVRDEAGQGAAHASVFVGPTR